MVNELIFPCVVGTANEVETIPDQRLLLSRQLTTAWQVRTYTFNKFHTTHECMQDLHG